MIMLICLLSRLFSYKVKVYFSEVASIAFKKAKEEKSLSTLRNYKTACRAFNRFLSHLGLTDIKIDCLTPDLIVKFSKWLEDQHIVPSTIACYMKKLRAMLNEYDDGKNYGYLFNGINTSTGKTKKKAAKEKNIDKLMSAQADRGNPNEEFALDIAKFQFCAMGMPFVDIANLKVGDIKDGYFEYYRHKTKAKVRVELNKALHLIINKYKAKTDSEYLFPIIHNSSDFSNEAHLALVRYNYQLKELSLKLDIPLITSYVIRHSWATFAFRNNTKLEVIAKALGHSHTSTTMIYIQGESDDKVAEANRMVLCNFEGLMCK